MSQSAAAWLASIGTQFQIEPSPGFPVENPRDPCSVASPGNTDQLDVLAVLRTRRLPRYRSPSSRRPLKLPLSKLSFNSGVCPNRCGRTESRYCLDEFVLRFRDPSGAVEQPAILQNGKIRAEVPRTVALGESSISVVEKIVVQANVIPLESRSVKNATQRGSTHRYYAVVERDR